MAVEHRHNLPAQVNSFIGRERELAEVTRLLAETRLLTLTGPGGIGKTRLAQQALAGLLDAYPGGIWVVELATLAEPALVPEAIAATLGVRDQPGRSLASTLADVLKPKTLLLMLDNCEPLVTACAELARSLLRACPRLYILATSRQPLGIAGEVAWRVPSLTMPALERLPVEGLMGYEAVRLFVERARAVLPVVTLTEHSAAATAEICRRLDGIPLAIELAAARVAALAPEQIAARLGDRFRLLTGGDQAALPRHRRLRALVDWSHELLSEPERVLLRRLAVFAGGWTLEAAENVCAGPGLTREEILDLLAQLVQKSLVVAEDLGGEVRYRFLETLQEYAWERLREAGEEAVLRDRHRDWFLALAEMAEPRLHGPEQRDWLARLEAGHDNLRAALAWSQVVLERSEATAAGRAEAPDSDEPSDADAALRLAGALAWFWWMRGHSAEGRRWLKKALTLGVAASTAARAKALRAHGMLAYGQGDFGRAVGLLEDAQALARRAGDGRTVANALDELAFMSVNAGDYAGAWARCEESLAISRTLGDRWEIARSLFFMGTVAHHQARYDQAERLIEESVALFREVGDTYGLAWSLHNLANVARDQGNHARAAGLLERTVSLAQHVGNDDLSAWARYQLGFMDVIRDDCGQAALHLREGLDLFREVGDQRGIAWSLHGLALVARGRGDAERAARLLGAADALRERIGAAWWPAQRTPFEQALVAVQTTLGEETFAAAWADGRAMPPDEVAEYALAASEGEATAEPAAPPATVDPARSPVTSEAAILTPRQREIAVLIAEGLTNRQIAEVLVLSELTVDVHVRNILARLGFTARAQVAAWAMARGLLESGSE